MLLLPSALRSKSGTRVEAQMALIPIGRQLHPTVPGLCAPRRSSDRHPPPEPRNHRTDPPSSRQRKRGNVRAWLFYERCHLHHSERHSRLASSCCRGYTSRRFYLVTNRHVASATHLFTGHLLLKGGMRPNRFRCRCQFIVRVGSLNARRSTFRYATRTMSLAGSSIGHKECGGWTSLPFRLTQTPCDHG
jgi:hypothetical protein